MKPLRQQRKLCEFLLDIRLESFRSVDMSERKPNSHIWFQCTWRAPISQQNKIFSFTRFLASKYILKNRGGTVVKIPVRLPVGRPASAAFGTTCAERNQVCAYRRAFLRAGLRTAFLAGLRTGLRAVLRTDFFVALRTVLRFAGAFLTGIFFLRVTIEVHGLVPNARRAHPRFKTIKINVHAMTSGHS